MRYYIVDDNLATVKTLENIINVRNLGTVNGFSTDPKIAFEDILKGDVDIVLVDLLMEDMDGIALVNEIKKHISKISFVMISKVSDKEMVQMAYSAGIDFFINKPINLVEVESVLMNVSSKIRMLHVMDNIKDMFDSVKSDDTKSSTLKGNDIDILLGNLGMLGEKGSKDIRNVFNAMLASRENYNRELLDRVADTTGDTSKNIEQRIRRAIKKGLSNAALIGIDNFDNDAFSIYAEYVFDFKTLRDEMNYLEGTGSSGGRISIAGFMEGLLLYYNS